MVDKAVNEVEMDFIMERLVEAEKFNVKLKAKEEDEKFKFSKPGCEKQFKFNIKMKDRFGVDLKTELERCFEKELPTGVKSLVEEVEKEIDEQNVKLKVADEFGFEAMEDFSKEDLARNKEEEKKIKVFRKEKKDREQRTVKKGTPRWFRKFRDDYNRCYSCWELGHVTRDCVRRDSGRGFRGGRR